MSPTIVDDEPPPAASSGTATIVSSSPISTTDEIDLTNTDSEDENQGNNTTSKTALSKGNLKVFSRYAKRLRRGTNAPKRYAEEDGGDEYEKPMVVTPRKPKRAKTSSGGNSSDCESSPASTPPSATSRSSTPKEKKTTSKKNEVKIGDIGYAFHKRFWVSEQGGGDNTNMKKEVEVFHGKVVGIIDGAYTKGEFCVLYTVVSDLYLYVEVSIH